VLPAAVTGVPGNHPEVCAGERSEWVYVTSDVDLARAYALAARGPRPDSRPRVLEVIPLEVVEVDESTVLGVERDSFRCSAASVVHVYEVDTTPRSPAWASRRSS
jgi:hypothetical protein